MYIHNDVCMGQGTQCPYRKSSFCSFIRLSNRGHTIYEYCAIIKFKEEKKKYISFNENNANNVSVH